MENDFYYIELFEIYKGLLTETQRETFYSHFCLDLSLAEIAEQQNTSRQSVFDAVKKVKAKLDEYESELKIKATENEILRIAEGVSDEKLKNELKGAVGR
ncbi:MAG: hypothetical protein SPL13_03135 [Clostridia bacterium]|nr:hypothetical protein [Clostridia bacterium]